MTYQIRDTITVQGVVHDLENMMTRVRNSFAHGCMEMDVYRSTMCFLVELRAGYPWDNDNVMLRHDGVACTLQFFFNLYGKHVIDLTAQDEIEEFEPRVLAFEEIDELINIDIDVQGTFFSEIEALDIMNDDIGEFDGSITFDLEGNTLETVDSDYTLGSEDSYSM